VTKGTISREALVDLREKYVEMHRLRMSAAAQRRVAHVSARSDANGMTDEPDPRRFMAKLASRYPGALREIDELTMHEIETRVRALEVAANDASKIERWMIATSLFHSLTRGALCAKRWLASHDRAARESYARDAASFAFADDALEWADDLARVADPPRGRITDLVYERIASMLDVSIDDARSLVFRSRR
jgi:hypothetical protein